MFWIFCSYLNGASLEIVFKQQIGLRDRNVGHVTVVLLELVQSTVGTRNPSTVILRGL